MEKEPRGHESDFRKGVADGIVGKDAYKDSIRSTRQASYQRGLEEGEKLRREIDEKIKK